MKNRRSVIDLFYWFDFVSPITISGLLRTFFRLLKFNHKFENIRRSIDCITIDLYPAILTYIINSVVRKSAVFIKIKNIRNSK